jgi:hypothetical protein
MRTFLTLATLLIFNTILFAQHPVNSIELIRNSGFEQGTHVMPFGKNIIMPEKWEMNASFIGSSELIQKKDMAKSGTNCLKIEFSPKTFPNRKKNHAKAIIMAGNLPVSLGKEYLVRMWVKGGESGEVFNLVIYQYSRQTNKKKFKYCGSRKIKALKELRLSDSWQMYQGLYVPEYNEFASIYVATLAIGTVKALFIDDVSFRLMDKRSLLEQVKVLKVEDKIKRYEGIFAEVPRLKETFSERFTKLTGKIIALQSLLQKTQLTPEQEFYYEKTLDSLKAEYKKIRYEIAFHDINF